MQPKGLKAHTKPWKALIIKDNNERNSGRITKINGFYKKGMSSAKSQLKEEMMAYEYEVMYHEYETVDPKDPNFEDPADDIVALVIDDVTDILYLPLQRAGLFFY